MKEIDRFIKRLFTAIHALLWLCYIILGYITATDVVELGYEFYYTALAHVVLIVVQVYHSKQMKR